VIRDRIRPGITGRGKPVRVSRRTRREAAHAAPSETSRDFRDSAWLTGSRRRHRSSVIDVRRGRSRVPSSGPTERTMTHSRWQRSAQFAGSARLMSTMITRAAGGISRSVGARTPATGGRTRSAVLLASASGAVQPARGSWVTDGGSAQTARRVWSTRTHPSQPGRQGHVCSSHAPHGTGARAPPGAAYPLAR
jgi:hypothetical protein